MNVNNDQALAYLQKFCGNQLRSKIYTVKLSEVYLVPCSWKGDDSTALGKCDDDNSEDEIQEVKEVHDTSPYNPVRRSSRFRKPPDWLATPEIESEWK